jgi:hypothetical protein
VVGATVAANAQGQYAAPLQTAPNPYDRAYQPYPYKPGSGGARLLRRPSFHPISERGAPRDPNVLKCTTVEGHHIADLTVDLENKMMRWAGQNYIIRNVTSEYITGIESADNSVPPVGGDVWVLNRVTGYYKRARVGMYYTDRTYPAGPVLEAYTESGKCVRPML